MKTLARILIISVLLLGCDSNKNGWGESYPDAFEPRDPVFLQCLRKLDERSSTDEGLGIIFDRANDALYKFTMGPHSSEKRDLKPTEYKTGFARRTLEAPVGKNEYASSWRYGASDADDPNVWSTHNSSKLENMQELGTGSILVLHRADLWVTLYWTTGIGRIPNNYECVLVPSWEELAENSREMDRQWNKQVAAKKARIKIEKLKAEARNKI